MTCFLMRKSNLIFFIFILTICCLSLHSEFAMDNIQDPEGISGVLILYKCCPNSAFLPCTWPPALPLSKRMEEFSHFSPKPAAHWDAGLLVDP